MSALHDAALIALIDLAADAEHDPATGLVSDEGMGTMQAVLDVVDDLEGTETGGDDEADAEPVSESLSEVTTLPSPDGPEAIADYLVSLSPAEAAIWLTEAHGMDMARELATALELMEAGYSGRKQDSAGRTRCYDDGKQVSCSAGNGDETDYPAHRDEHARAAHEHVSRLIDDPTSATADDVKRTAELLGRLTAAEARQIQKAHGLRAGGNKAELVKRIASEAAKVVQEHRSWSRKARAAGAPPAALFSTAREMHRLAREYQQTVKRMLAEARALYRSETGKALTRNHPAFRGGDHAGLPGFDSVARTMAGRYPELLGAHGYGMADDDESAAPKLFEMLSLGTPAVPKRTHAYAQALDYLKDQVSLFGKSSRQITSDEELPF